MILLAQTAGLAMVHSPACRLVTSRQLNGCVAGALRDIVVNHVVGIVATSFGNSL